MVTSSVSPWGNRTAMQVRGLNPSAAWDDVEYQIRRCSNIPLHVGAVPRPLNPTTFSSSNSTYLVPSACPHEVWTLDYFCETAIDLLQLKTSSWDTFSLVLCTSFLFSSLFTLLPLIILQSVLLQEVIASKRRTAFAELQETYAGPFLTVKLPINFPPVFQQLWSSLTHG